VTRRTRIPVGLGLAAALVLTACATATPSPSADPTTTPAPTLAPTPAAGDVIPAPGSTSAVYAPNPGALVVAIDPGHGGCLDWGVPDPRARGAASSEKAMTLAIGLALRDLLEAQGVTVVMTRTDDEALAGDDYPALGCTGPPWRDVNGDGESGFDPEGATRTRDELQARLDLANVARADVLVSIHINSLTQDGVVFEIAATETFYTDETPWGPTAAARLAQLVQSGVVARLGAVAGYDRQDRGIEAKNLFVVAPPLLVPTEDRPDPRKQPTRGALMPAILTEVGSITLAAEQDLLTSAPGQEAAAQGIADALAEYFADRPLAVRYDAMVASGSAGTIPQPVPGDGPPYWVPTVATSDVGDGFTLRLTNTGTAAWPANLQLAVGVAASDQPYLRLAPGPLAPLPLTIPALAPGESVDLPISWEPPAGATRQIAWFTLVGEDGPLTTRGSAPLQLAVP
jgi:N-acetylmuramoyl-L-alanine amidase